MIRIYAGESKNAMSELPSPESITPSYELIWSENTGRGQSSADKSKMVGDVVGEKVTYAIKWGMLTRSQVNTIRSKLQGSSTNRGFFYFGIGETLADAKEDATTFYRSEITGEMQYDGRIKDVQVSVIEQ